MRELPEAFRRVFATPYNPLISLEDPPMSKVRVSALTLSLDGYGAGPHQTLQDPLGRGGERLHEWLLLTRTFNKLHGSSDGTNGIDDELAARGFENVGAWIMGRNMFGPARGPWPEDSWKGW